MATIITVSNQKGGVGKTTTSAALEAICQTDYCDILASDITLSSGVEQAAAEHRECILKNTLAPVMEEYDYVIIDTPPALNLLTVNAYTVSDYLIIPMASDILSLVGLAQLKETIESVRGGLNPRLHVLGIKIRNGVAIAEAPAHGESIFDYNPRSAAVKDYMAFIDEIAETIHLKEA